MLFVGTEARDLLCGFRAGVIADVEPRQILEVSISMKTKS